MSPYDAAGRIHKRAFLISNLVLFVLCMIATLARFYVRIHVQRQFSIDDGILLFGVACLIAAMALIFTFVDQMYLVGAAEAGMTDIELPSDFIQQAYDFQKFVTVALILTWCSIVSVKFSYLFLFKRLINRIRPLMIYWWFTVIFNAMTSIYGAVVYGVACPHYYSLKALQCAFGEGVDRSITFSVSQMVLDVIGDLFILYIPFRLIWKIKIKWSHKIALMLCLCLTILTILCTVIRAAGINTGHHIKSIDSVWETYWQYVAANIALMMTAATAFRTFFISGVNNQEAPAPQSKETWYTKGRKYVRYTLTPRSWRSKRSPESTGDGDEANWNHRPYELPLQAPRATMTGIRTFIHGQGRTKMGHSQIMHSMLEEGYEHSWPVSDKGRSAPSIMVQQDIAVRSENI